MAITPKKPLFQTTEETVRHIVLSPFHNLKSDRFSYDTIPLNEYKEALKSYGSNFLSDFESFTKSFDGGFTESSVVIFDPDVDPSEHLPINFIWDRYTRPSADDYKKIAKHVSVNVKRDEGYRDVLKEVFVCGSKFTIDLKIRKSVESLCLSLEQYEAYQGGELMRSQLRAIIQGHIARNLELLLFS
tara:strand:- start:98069 stop:98629 length:561 start_codon:yes stop_codon:yes gene_type:complete